MHVSFWSEIMEGREHLEYIDLDGRGILKWMLMKGGKVELE